VLPTMTKMLDNHIIATADIIRQKLLVELVYGFSLSRDANCICSAARNV
jgi:hypothetical protein